jgi:hypothetical protein
MQTFADFAPGMRAAGWAVLPGQGKAPQVNGFNTWKHAPGPETISRWAKLKPDADILYVPGLCQTPKGHGIIIVDPDDEVAIGQAEELFGDTPAKIRTRRGQHRGFAAAGVDLGELTSLRRYGLNIDLKHGQRGAGIVVGPPSAHEKDRSFRYAWDGCDETVIRHLPPFPEGKLKAFLNKQAKPDLKPLRDGFQVPGSRA